MKADYTSKQVAKVIVKHVKLHGFPKTIVSKRDKVFTNHFDDTFKLNGIQMF